MDNSTQWKTLTDEKEDRCIVETRQDTGDKNPDIKYRKDDDERERDSTRDDRFVETDDHPEFLQSRQFKNMKPYYSGSILDDRNAEMRKSIYYIRQHWDDFGIFTKWLKELFLNDEPIAFKDKTTEEDFERLFSRQRNWMTEESVHTEPVSFEAIRLYTSDEGYKRIYKLCNHVFRDEHCLISTKEIRSVVFLIELINIDLYNYCLLHSEKRDYQGTVYRGMVLNEMDFEQFKRLRHAPSSSRNIAVPLVLFSASFDVGVARRFIKHRLKEASKEGLKLQPVVYKINIIGLKPEFIQHFKSRFPKMTLTSMGAVDIHEISRHPGEKEVILRGPYTLILDIYDDEKDLVGVPCSVLEALVITSNRDHITTSQPGPDDDLARDMYGAMVIVTRSEYAVQYCRSKGLHRDESDFQDILENARIQLDKLWNL
ncbi:uncharacterized protein LOC127872824 [Dreissena polymorpha]|uniref:Uncharacterized protein n=1 Tax=Dreissena polymorpha TaxID=45954 RepID=A0A9D4KR11_DREPO|nr:uncharacterized protein LOC127872824 [Dreissena polymorpha]KAH3844505.1 hypothetical protein DPMN_086763 [Dreissena polymorpha]